MWCTAAVMILLNRILRTIPGHGMARLKKKNQFRHDDDERLNFVFFSTPRISSICQEWISFVYIRTQHQASLWNLINFSDRRTRAISKVSRFFSYTAFIASLLHSERGSSYVPGFCTRTRGGEKVKKSNHPTTRQV